MRIPILAVALAVFAAGCMTTPASDLAPGEQRTGHGIEGSDAPAYTAQDLDGNNVSLADHLGTPVLFHIWASWCSVCEGEEPELARLYDEYGDVVDFVMVSIDSRAYESAMRGEAAQWPYENWWDPEDRVRPLFNVEYQPVTIFIGADGSVDSV